MYKLHPYCQVCSFLLSQNVLQLSLVRSNAGDGGKNAHSVTPLHDVTDYFRSWRFWIQPYMYLVIVIIFSFYLEAFWKKIAVSGCSLYLHSLVSQKNSYCTRNTQHVNVKKNRSVLKEKKSQVYSEQSFQQFKSSTLRPYNVFLGVLR